MDGSRLVNALVQSDSDQRIAAIVPKRGRRSKRHNRAPGIIPTTEQLLRLGQGCSCCTVRGDIRAKIRRLAQEQTADHILIETTPHSDLVTLAKTFTVADNDGSSLSELAEIRNMVAVLDARTTITSLQSASARSVLGQIELANLLLIDQGTDLDEQERELLTSLLEAVNPHARITWTTADPPSLDALQAPQPFDLDTAQRRANLASVLRGEWEPSDTVARLAYRVSKPFHPARLHAFIQQKWPGMVRAQGSFWVASRPASVGMLDVAGENWTTAEGGMWWAAVPEAERPKSLQFKAYMDAVWHPTFGDRRQELAFVAVSTKAEALRAALDACLMTDEELSTPEQWSALPHPFPWPRASA